MQFFFAIPRNSLPVRIIRTDTSWIISFKYQIGKVWQKNKRFG